MVFWYAKTLNRAMTATFPPTGVQPIVPIPACPPIVTGLATDVFWPARAAEQPGFQILVTTDSGDVYRVFKDKWSRRGQSQRPVNVFCQPAINRLDRLDRLIELDAPDFILDNERSLIKEKITYAVDILRDLAKKDKRTLPIFIWVVSHDDDTRAMLKEASGDNLQGYLGEQLASYDENDKATRSLWTGLFVAYKKLFDDLHKEWLMMYRPYLEPEFCNLFPQLDLPISARAVRRGLRDVRSTWSSVLDPIEDPSRSGFFGPNHREAFLDVHKLALGGYDAGPRLRSGFSSLMYPFPRNSNSNPKSSRSVVKSTSFGNLARCGTNISMSRVFRTGEYSIPLK